MKNEKARQRRVTWQGGSCRVYNCGRISVFRGVDAVIVRKEQVPAFVAPEDFQAEQGFVSFLAPVLSGAFETALRLTTRRFNGPAADGLAAAGPRTVIHPVLVLLQVLDLLGDSLGAASGRQIGQ